MSPTAAGTVVVDARRITTVGDDAAAAAGAGAGGAAACTTHVIVPDASRAVQAQQWMASSPRAIAETGPVSGAGAQLTLPTTTTVQSCFELQAPFSHWWDSPTKIASKPPNSAAS